MKVAMVGNPNVGKTSLLNALTGGDFSVGNFPGVTVEKKEGKGLIDGKAVTFVDLPGIYSFQTESLDEKVARDYLEKEKPDLILNVVNALNLERNLYLTLQLTRFGIPMVIALNMIDEAEKERIRIDTKKLSEIIGVPVIKTSAVKGVGIEELKREILRGGSVPKVFSGDLQDIIRMAEKIAREVKVVEKLEKPEIDEALDEVFMDRHLGIPIFLSFMWMMFMFTYSVAQPLNDLLSFCFDGLASYVASFDGWFFSMLGDGVVAGVGSVLSFVPNIAFLFLFLSLLELSGYMPRAVFLVDGFMSRFGLNGRSVIPLIMGFGCNVPAILATRSIEDRKVRIVTALINPFMSCSARLPIYVLFAGIFFPKTGSVVVMSMYVIGVLIALISALILRKTLLKGESEFIMELPPYMLPNLKELWLMTWSRTKHFIQKAGTVILAMSVVVWYITTYPGGSIEESYAAMLGKAIQPLFSPMGWSWELVLALVSGFVAKEVVVATIGVLNIDVPSVMTSYQAFAYMLFTLLYMPCIATIAAIRAEIGTRWAMFAVLFSFSVAYAVALIATGVGMWF
ncbi:ferrous iron transport protein B [Archaeoglobus sp.]|uniref:ferrous iron transport protein B n=1 Tax=Archaeoglobus sp. TaxID=1872626 RepID=UPI0025C593A9|nr:ferrous iron transport protein B [Archaeoglobus sp.]